MPEDSAQHESPISLGRSTSSSAQDMVSSPASPLSGSEKISQRSGSTSTGGELEKDRKRSKRSLDRREGSRSISRSRRRRRSVKRVRRSPCSPVRRSQSDKRSRRKSSSSGYGKYGSSKISRTSSRSRSVKRGSRNRRSRSRNRSRSRDRKEQSFKRKRSRSRSRSKNRADKKTVSSESLLSSKDSSQKTSSSRQSSPGGKTASSNSSQSLYKKTRIVAALNISLLATQDQLWKLFSFLGRIKDIVLFPPVQNMPVSSDAPYRVCLVKFASSLCTRVALHLTGTVFLDKSLLVVPCEVNEIPDSEHVWDAVFAGVRQLIDASNAPIVKDSDVRKKLDEAESASKNPRNDRNSNPKEPAVTITDVDVSTAVNGIEEIEADSGAK